MSKKSLFKKNINNHHTMYMNPKKKVHKKYREIEYYKQVYNFHFLQCTASQEKWLNI